MFQFFNPFLKVAREDACLRLSSSLFQSLGLRKDIALCLDMETIAKFTASCPRKMSDGPTPAGAFDIKTPQLMFSVTLAMKKAHQDE